MVNHGKVQSCVMPVEMDVDEYFAKTPVSIPQINDICINRLNELNQYCNEKSAKLVVAGYPIAYGKYSKFTKNDFINFKEELDNRLDCDVISDYTDYFYPYNYYTLFDYKSYSFPPLDKENHVYLYNSKGSEFRYITEPGYFIVTPVQGMVISHTVESTTWLLDFLFNFEEY